MGPQSSKALLNDFASCSRSEFATFVDSAVTSLCEKSPCPLGAKSKTESDTTFGIKLNEETDCYTDKDANHDQFLVFHDSVIANLCRATLLDDNDLPDSSKIRAKGTALLALETIKHRLPEKEDSAIASALHSFAKIPISWSEQSRDVKGGMIVESGDVTTNAREVFNEKVDFSAWPRHSFENIHLPNVTVLSRPSPTRRHNNPEMSTLVLPCAGRSSRFPGFKPKWLLTMPSGKLMFVEAISKLDLSSVTHVAVGVLKEHIDQHCGGDASSLFQCLLKESHLAEMDLTFVVIESPTKDQVQTIECILNHAHIQGSIFLKDCDNQFCCSIPTTNALATLEITKDLKYLDIPAGKSYAQFDSTGNLANIVEKQVIGPQFCVGGYSFSSCKQFLEDVQRARDIQNQCNCLSLELAISDILWFRTITAKGAETVQLSVSGYEDWGTLQAWKNYFNTFRTLFIDIDGTLIKNTGAYFKPSWGMAEPLIKNVAHLRRLRELGRTQIILTTSRTESFRNITEKQLDETGIQYDHIIFGLNHCKRVLVNDYAKTNPFPSALSINLMRDSDDLSELLGVY